MKAALSQMSQIEIDAEIFQSDTHKADRSCQDRLVLTHTMHNVVSLNSSMYRLFHDGAGGWECEVCLTTCRVLFTLVAVVRLRQFYLPHPAPPPKNLSTEIICQIMTHCQRNSLKKPAAVIIQMQYRREKKAWCLSASAKAYRLMTWNGMDLWAFYF